MTEFSEAVTAALAPSVAAERAKRENMQQHAAELLHVRRLAAAQRAPLPEQPSVTMDGPHPLLALQERAKLQEMDRQMGLVRERKGS